MGLFQYSLLNKYLKELKSDKIKDAYQISTSSFHNSIIQEDIHNYNEEHYQDEFVIDFF